MKRFNSFKTVSSLSAYIFLSLFVLIPTLFIVLISFLTADALGNIKLHFTVDNFKQLLNPVYFNVLLNSIKIAFITTILTLLFAYPLAFIVSKSKTKLQHILFLLIILPYWTNSLVRTYAFLVILRADGFINNLLIFSGLIQNPVQLLYTEGAVISAMVYLLLPVMFLPIYSSVTKLDTSYIDAARDLGAKPKNVFTDVIIPLTIPGIVAGCVLVFTPCLGLFFISDFIGGGKTVLLGNIIKDQFSTTRNLPFGSALSLVMMIIALIFIAIYYRISLYENTKKGSSK